MNFTYEQGITADGVEWKITAHIPKPQVVDVSRWPEFTVEWMGRRLEGVYITYGVYAINGIAYLQDGPDDYPVVTQDLLAKWAKEQPSEPAIDSAMFFS